MKRILLAITIALLPAAAFADLQLGAVAIYDQNIFSPGNTSLSLSDFQFGGEARLALGILQASAYAYFLSSTDFSVIGVYPDLGLSIPLASFLRLGVAAGPTIDVVLGSGAAAGAKSIGGSSAKGYTASYYAPPVAPASNTPIPLVGGNLKFMADLTFGSLSIGVVGYYVMKTVTDLTEQKLIQLFTSLPSLGITVLLKLF
jgi:hypothetical protein